MRAASNSWRPITTGACVLALAMMININAKAGVISAMPDTSFASTPVSITLGSGVFTFTAIPNTFPGNPPDKVSTAGSANVSSLLGGVADFSAGAIIGANQLYGFSAFPLPAIIPNSAAQDFIGLTFTDTAGLHYGYAEVFGTQLVSYGYETVANAPIRTGATAMAEPMTITMMLSGLAGLILAKRCNRTGYPLGG